MEDEDEIKGLPDFETPRAWLKLSRAFERRHTEETAYKNIETKSRYEVIADLERQKRDLILQRDSLDDVLKQKEKSLKDLKREVEDKEDEIKDFKSKMVSKKETLKELIVSVEQSLERFAKLKEKESK